MERSRTHIYYGIADLAAAALYLYIFVFLVPARSSALTALAIGLSGIMAAGGVGMLLNSSKGRMVAGVSSVVMLLACLALIVALAASAAFLHGIYNGIGQAGVAIAALCAALSVEVVGLLPALQLAYLRRTAPKAG